MSETGIPSKTATASKAERLQSLFGPDFAVYVEWDPFEQQYRCQAIKSQYAQWIMVKEDFDHYTDSDLIEKFINPAKGVFK